MAEFTDTIDIAAPPAVVFDLLTTPSGLAKWMGVPIGVDASPSGAFAVDIAGYPVRGRYTVVDRPTHVAFTWGFAGSDDLPPGASTVEFRLTGTDDGTRVELLHRDLPDQQVAGHARGWRHYLPRLVVVGSAGDAGPDHWGHDVHD